MYCSAISRGGSTLSSSESFLQEKNISDMERIKKCDLLILIKVNIFKQAQDTIF